LTWCKIFWSWMFISNNVECGQQIIARCCLPLIPIVRSFFLQKEIFKYGNISIWHDYITNWNHNLFLFYWSRFASVYCRTFSKWTKRKMVSTNPSNLSFKIYQHLNKLEICDKEKEIYIQYEFVPKMTKRNVCFVNEFFLH